MPALWVFCQRTVNENLGGFSFVSSFKIPWPDMVCWSWLRASLFWKVLISSLFFLIQSLELGIRSNSSNGNLQVIWRRLGSLSSLPKMGHVWVREGQLWLHDFSLSAWEHGSPSCKGWMFLPVGFSVHRDSWTRDAHNTAVMMWFHFYFRVNVELKCPLHLMPASALSINICMF